MDKKIEEIIDELCVEFGIAKEDFMEEIKLQNRPIKKIRLNDFMEKITFEDGSVYEGETVNGRPHGKGKMIFNNSSIYEGEFANGGTWGEGKQTYPDGRIYEGDFYYDSHDEPIGEGKMTYPDGRIIEGRWKNCKFISK